MTRVEGEIEQYRLLAVIFAHIERQRIELVAAGQTDQLEAGVADGKVVIVLLVGERHVEELAAPEARQAERVLHVLDRRPLMPVVAPQLLADMGDELLYRGARRDLQAQRHHPGEHADSALEIGRRPVEDRHADGDIIAPHRPREQSREQCGEHMEWRRAALAADVDEPDI